MITSDGKVAFSAFCFGDGFDQFTVGRKTDCTIGQEQVQSILQSRAALLQSPDMELKMDDGIWTVQAIEENGETFEKEGSLVDVFIEGISLSKYIRKRLPIEKLWLFGEQPEGEDNRDSAVTLDDFPKG